MADERKALPPHVHYDWIADLLVCLCKQQGVPDANIPVRPIPVEPEPPADANSDVDELRRILADNPALRQAIKTDDI